MEGKWGHRDYRDRRGMGINGTAPCHSCNSPVSTRGPPSTTPTSTDQAPPLLPAHSVSLMLRVIGNTPATRLQHCHSQKVPLALSDSFNLCLNLATVIKQQVCCRGFYWCFQSGDIFIITTIPHIILRRLTVTGVVPTIHGTIMVWHSTQIV